MSKRKSNTYRAATALGINPYGWGNGKGRKRPKEVKKKKEVGNGTEKSRA